MRYSGSKARFQKDLSPILSENLNGENEFVDAFGGGMNLVCAIDYNKKVAIDCNRYVIALWNRIKSGDVSFIPQCLDEEEYYDVKSSYMSQDGRYDDAYIGYVATACSFGGGWWNGYAHFNPKKNEDHIKEAYNGIMRQIDKFKYLKDTQFICCSYSDYAYKPNSVIYNDPPYADTKGYESDFDHFAFWNWVEKMSNDGHHVYTSEYTCPTDGRFECIWRKQKSDGMGTTRNGDRQQKRVEKLFVYKNPIIAL